MEYSEDEVTEIIQRIARKLAPKYVFGYFDKEDLAQEAIIMGFEALSRYDSNRPLENFLYVHISNRLKTFKRDNYFRMNAGGAEGVQQAKKNIMDAIPIECAEPYKENDILSILELKDLRARIDAELPAHLRKDYLRLCAGAKITAKSKEKVIEAIRKIFNVTT